MILTEAQTTWTMNIIIRALMYLVQSYHEYFERRNDKLYGSKKVKVPPYKRHKKNVDAPPKVCYPINVVKTK